MKTALYIPPSSIWNDLEGFGKSQVMALIGQFLKEKLSLVRQFGSIFINQSKQFLRHWPIRSLFQMEIRGIKGAVFWEETDAVFSEISSNNSDNREYFFPDIQNINIFRISRRYIFSPGWVSYCAWKDINYFSFSLLFLFLSFSFSFFSHPKGPFQGQNNL